MSTLITRMRRNGHVNGLLTTLAVLAIVVVQSSVGAAGSAPVGLASTMAPVQVSTVAHSDPDAGTISLFGLFRFASCASHRATAASDEISI
ncbi:MAG: hypothetical protein AAF732_13405 [Pseudomonadota bacterium]